MYCIQGSGRKKQASKELDVDADVKADADEKMRREGFRKLELIELNWWNNEIYKQTERETTDRLEN